MTDRSDWNRWLPGLQTARHYEAAWLPHDVMAGLVLASMLVPVGIAYATASGLPGIYGLYATIVPLLAYALFGPSRILVLGPDSALVAVILGVVVPLSGGDPQRAIMLAGAMAIVSGTICVLAGIARLGFVTELLSKPIRYGYMNGIALTVLISQTAQAVRLLDRKRRPAAKPVGYRRRDPGGQDQLDRVRGRRGNSGGDPAAEASQAPAGHPDRGRRGDRRSSQRWIWRTRGNVSVLGPLPQGLPAFAIPWIRTDDIVPVLIGGTAVALVSFADTSVLSRAYAARIRHPRRSQPGDGGAWRRQSRRGLLPGLSDQQQQLAHPGR